MANVTTAVATPAMPAMGDVEFGRWARLLEARTGIIVPIERKPFLETGLRRRMRETGHVSYDSYYEQLVDGVHGAIEWATLVDHLTVHETCFFRHQPSLDLVTDAWLPDWLERSGEGASLHALSLGCSTGEEAYSLALAFDTRLHDSATGHRFGITATDVSQAALSVAREATYPMRCLAQIPAACRSQLEMLPDGEHFRIGERVRKRVGFACVNLLHAARAPLRKLDLVYCQNVLIYFARERRHELLDAMAELLRPGGLMVLGPGEVSGWSHPKMVRSGNHQTLAFLRNQ